LSAELEKTATTPASGIDTPDVAVWVMLN